MASSFAPAVARLTRRKGLRSNRRRAAAIAVIENPFAGRYVEDLSPLIAIGEELGELLSKRAVAALGIDGSKAQSYGKAAAVVMAGAAMAMGRFSRVMSSVRAATAVPAIMASRMTRKRPWS